MNNSAIDALSLKREQLLTDKAAMIVKFDTEIAQLEVAMETLSGKKVWEITNEERFDDTSTDYIRSSQEEI